MGFAPPKGVAVTVRNSFTVLLAAALVASPATTTVLSGPAEATGDRPTLLVVVGAAGEPEFGRDFARQTELWHAIADQAGAPITFIGPDPRPAEPDPDRPGAADTRPPEPFLPPASDLPAPAARFADPHTPDSTDLDRLRLALTAACPTGAAPLWLVLIGHGTFDGREARFNLRGPDLTATQLSEWVTRFERPLIVINTTSASAPFLPRLSGRDRVVITATRSGYEQNYARFGLYLAEALLDPASDLDQDGQTSLLEAFLAASNRIVEFYRTEGRLVTEHALLDDNGDGLGTPADWFRGVRAVRRAAEGAPVDGIRAHQFHLLPSAAEQALPLEVRARRDALEREILHLREQKDRLPADNYYQQLERLLIELARLYAAAAD